MNSFVYFILNDRAGLLKVGLSHDPVSRLRSLQTSSGESLVLLGKIAGTRQTETYIHASLGDCRNAGEWFSYTGRVQQFVATALRVGLAEAVRGFQKGIVRNRRFGSVKEFERALRDELGLSRGAAKKVVEAGYSGLSADGAA